MCIIAVKPAGTRCPDSKTFAAMWHANPDGAGYMYADPDNGRVYTRKGFMTLKAFEKDFLTLSQERDLTDLPVIFHFRIGTHGGNTASNTHPFPVTRDEKALKALTYEGSLAVVHNGIIPGVYPRKGISDTMEYILTSMVELRELSKEFYLTLAGKRLMYLATRSKLAFLDAFGNISLVGDFLQGKDGLQYSNGSYIPFRPFKPAWDIYSDVDEGEEEIDLLKLDRETLSLMWLDGEKHEVTEHGKTLRGKGVSAYAIDRHGKAYVCDYDFASNNDLYFTRTSAFAFMKGSKNFARFYENKALPQQVVK